MTVDQNVAEWSNYGWETRGSEWSHSWGGDDALWHAVVYARIRAFLPSRSALEIGCGHGRMTHFLAKECQHITGYDVTPKCVNYCQQNFPAHNFFVGDGKTFPQVPSASIDFAFSWDVLVHCDFDVLASYLAELRRVLAPAACAFLHHSNAADSQAVNNGLRAATSHAQVATLCERLGLNLKAQEIVHWEGALRMDCFSLIENTPWCGTPTAFVNDDWTAVQRNALRVAKVYQ